MSANPGIRIGRWHNHFVSAQPLPAELLASADQALHEQDLDADLDRLNPEDEWIAIRSLKLHTRIDEFASLTGATWQANLLQQLQAVLAAGDTANLVRYANRRAVLTDMLYRAACQDLTRSWAWQQLGLLPATAQYFDHQFVLIQAARQLAAEAYDIWPVLTHLLRADTSTGAFTQLLVNLPQSHWLELLSRCPQTSGYLHTKGDLAVAPNACEPNWTPMASHLKHWVEQYPWQARSHSRVVRLLLCAACHPLDGLLNSAPALIGEVLSRSSQWLEGQLQSQTRPATRSSPPPAQTQRALDRQTQATELAPSLAGNKHSADRSGTGACTDPMVSANDEMAAPELPPTGVWQPSLWVGLLYLVNLMPAHIWQQAFARLGEPFEHHRAESALEPSCLIEPRLAEPIQAEPRQAEPSLAEPRLAEPSHTETIQAEAIQAEPFAAQPDIGRQLLWHLASRYLHVPTGDPALKAFCGGWQPQALHLAGPDSHLVLHQALDPIAADLLQQLEQHLAARTDMPIAELINRPGAIRIEPGWIDVRQSLERADVRLRRAALDLNPGWVPWLGCVVRFIYD